MKSNKGNSAEPSNPKQRRGPSFSAMASLATLAVSLWFEVELSAALFRSVLVYLGLSMTGLIYRAILSHYLASSEERARQELLDKLAREAEEEMKKQAEAEKIRSKAEAAKSVKVKSDKTAVPSHS